jgi:hypothetical protein
MNQATGSRSSLHKATSPYGQQNCLIAIAD